MRDTGPSHAVRLEVMEREHYRCKLCHCALPEGRGQIHHRRPRQRGGTRWPGINLPSNLAWIGLECHEFIESHRTLAYERGWLVHSWDDPAEVTWLPLLEGMA